MTKRKSLIAAVIGTVLSALLACCHLLDTLYDTANANLEQGMETFVRPGIVQALSSPVLLPASLVLFTVIIIACGIACSDFPEYPAGRSSIGSGIFGLLAVAAVGYTSVASLIEIGKRPTPQIESSPGSVQTEIAANGLPPIIWQICMGLGAGAALALAIISIGFFTGTSCWSAPPCSWSCRSCGWECGLCLPSLK